jgi:hypothetical protein
MSKFSRWRWVNSWVILQRFVKINSVTLLAVQAQNSFEEAKTSDPTQDADFQSLTAAGCHPRVRWDPAPPPVSVQSGF